MIKQDDGEEISARFDTNEIVSDGTPIVFDPIKVWFKNKEAIEFLRDEVFNIYDSNIDALCDLPDRYDHSAEYKHALETAKLILSYNIKNKIHLDKWLQTIEAFAERIANNHNKNGYRGFGFNAFDGVLNWFQRTVFETHEHFEKDDEIVLSIRLICLSRVLHDCRESLSVDCTILVAREIGRIYGELNEKYSELGIQGKAQIKGKRKRSEIGRKREPLFYLLEDIIHKSELQDLKASEICRTLTNHNCRMITEFICGKTYTLEGFKTIEISKTQSNGYKTKIKCIVYYEHGESLKTKSKKKEMTLKSFQSKIGEVLKHLQK